MIAAIDRHARESLRMNRDDRVSLGFGRESEMAIGIRNGENLPIVLQKFRPAQHNAFVARAKGDLRAGCRAAVRQSHGSADGLARVLLSELEVQDLLSDAR